MRAKAFVFDFDGLIIDTESGPWYRTVSEEFEAHGASLPLDEWQVVIGTEHRHWLDWLDWPARSIAMSSRPAGPGVTTRSSPAST